MDLNFVQQNGVTIVRTPGGVGLEVEPRKFWRPLVIEVGYEGRTLKRLVFDPSEVRWRDAFHGVDMLRCSITVKGPTGVVLAELKAPGPLPFMVRQGEQTHITESYVSVPPALTITDEVGAVWTLGFARAEKAPRGEYAFNVLRDGVETGETASRIERRNAKTRIFTRHGWRVWNGNTFI